MRLAKLPTIDIQRFRGLSLASVIGVGMLIVSGGLVRLTDSGLGCPDWPSCARTTFVGPLSFHKDVEFGNRLVSVVVTFVVAATVLGVFRLAPRRKDLLFPALLMISGIAAQIVLGGLVVLYHLWPPLVMVHFLASEGLVVVALVLYLRARLPEGPAVAMVSPRFVALSRLLVVVASVVIAIGTAVSASGPHGGSRSAKRLPLPYRGVTELHATVVAFLVGLILATLFATWIGDCPQPVLRRAQILLSVAVVQGVIGYAQFFLRVPIGLVDLHLAGATAVLCAVVAFHLGLFSKVGSTTTGFGGPAPPQTSMVSGAVSR